MRWLVRFAFLALLALGLGGKLSTPPSSTVPEPTTSLSAVLGPRLIAPVTVHPGAQTVILSAPIGTCSAPLLAAPVEPTFTTAAIVEQVRRPGDHAFYAYLDWVSDHPDRWGLLKRRVQEKAAEALGVSPYDGDSHMLFISEPPGCSVARDAPWRRYWLLHRSGPPGP
ncbi:MAG TPA: hypothetical protein VN694_11405 [Caulobacteraceae bacterium]|nr:hypothetical protein [Caulobacteraceae bacterium]